MINRLFERRERVSDKPRTEILIEITEPGTYETWVDEEEYLDRSLVMPFAPYMTLKEYKDSHRPVVGVKETEPK